MKKISILSVAVLSVMMMASPILALSTTLSQRLSAEASAGASASSTKAAKVAAALATRIQTGQSHATAEIDRRVTVLNNLSTKVSAMTRLNATDKTNIASLITQQVSSLTDLKTKILADTDTTTLKADVKSITDSYRIFMLVVPQINVITTSDSMIETSNMIGAIGTKLQARVAIAGTAGNNVTALNTLLSDITAKINDAQTQAQNAVLAVASLKPDQGDTATITANKQAFTTAKGELKTARTDLQTARTDAGKIVTSLKAMKVSTATSTPASATSTMTQ